MLLTPFKKVLLVAMSVLPLVGMAADKTTTPAKPVTPVVASADKEPIFGSQLMTVQERLQFRSQMQNATTAEEREKIRIQHREQMLERAKAQGVTLSDTPMMNRKVIRAGKGRGMGNGSSSSSGQGSGGGGSGNGNSGGGNK